MARRYHPRQPQSCGCYCLHFSGAQHRFTSHGFAVSLCRPALCRAGRANAAAAPTSRLSGRDRSSCCFFELVMIVADRVARPTAVPLLWGGNIGLKRLLGAAQSGAQRCEPALDLLFYWLCAAARRIFCAQIRPSDASERTIWVAVVGSAVHASYSARACLNP